MRPRPSCELSPQPAHAHSLARGAVGLHYTVTSFAAPRLPQQEALQGLVEIQKEVESDAATALDVVSMH